MSGTGLFRCDLIYLCLRECLAVCVLAGIQLLLNIQLQNILIEDYSQRKGCVPSCPGEGVEKTSRREREGFLQASDLDSKARMHHTSQKKQASALCTSKMTEAGKFAVLRQPQNELDKGLFWDHFLLGTEE